MGEPQDKTPSFKFTGLENLVTEHAVLLAGLKDDTLVPMGTGVFVSPRLLLTAAHVIDGLWGGFEGTSVPTPDQIKQSSHVLIAVQWPKSDAQAAVWIVDKATRCTGTDLAFARVTPSDALSETYEWKKCFRISLDIPPIGASMVAFGYPDTKVLAWDNDTARLSISPITATGIVTDVFRERRDRGMLNFPCYQINARIEGGMSGGPVFDEKGRLCGILCTGMSGDPNLPHVSMVSALWPAMFTTLEFELPGINPRGPYQVWQLAKNDAIHAPEWQAIHGRAYTTEDDQGNSVIRLKPE